MNIPVRWRELIEAGRWPETFAEATVALRASFRHCLVARRKGQETDLLDTDLPLAFSAGYRAACALAEQITLDMAAYRCLAESVGCKFARCSWHRLLVAECIACWQF